ncbi:MAG: hypothetical protein WBB48_11905 [Thermodesulfobacteriota bacterium]
MLYGIRIALSVIMLVSVLWLTLCATRQRSFLPALGLIVGAGIVLSTWIIETPAVYNFGAVISLSIMAFWAARCVYQSSSSGETGSCKEC